MFSRGIPRAFARPSRCLMRNLHTQPSPLPRRLPRGPLQTNAIRARHKSTGQAVRELWKENPFSMSAFSVIFTFLCGMAIYVNFHYQYNIVALQEIYPEPVFVKLRRALYYADYKSSPKEALRYYREALAAAEQCGMDPLSDEIVGIKTHMAGFLERVGELRIAIRVLETARAGCLAWERNLGGKKELRAKRTKVLKHAVAISVKLASLYGCQYVQEWDKAEETLVWAVDTVERERRRRDAEGVTEEDEGEWMSDEEMGGSFEALAHFYESKDEYILATPLFLRALSHCPTDTCHAVTLMNNIAISLAQQPPPSSTPPSSFPSLPEQATLWARKSLSLARSIPDTNQSPECATAAAVATYNLASLAETGGRLAEAETLYADARRLAADAPAEDAEVWHGESWGQPKTESLSGAKSEGLLRGGGREAHPERWGWGYRIWNAVVGEDTPNERAMEEADRRRGSALAFDPVRAERVARGEEDEEDGKAKGWFAGWWNPLKGWFGGGIEERRGYKRGFEEGIQKAEEGLKRVKKLMAEEEKRKEI